MTMDSQYSQELLLVASWVIAEVMLVWKLSLALAEAARVT